MFVFRPVPQFILKDWCTFLRKYAQLGILEKPIAPHSRIRVYVGSPQFAW